MVKSRTWWVMGLVVGCRLIGAPAVFGVRVQIPAGTTVALRLEQTVTSDSSINDPVDFTVVDAVKVGGLVVVPAGARATGVVSESKAGGKLHGKPRLAIKLGGVYAADNKTVIPLHFAAGSSYSVASPSKKRAARIDRGTQFTAYVDRDTAIEIEPPRAPEPTASLTAVPASTEKGKAVTLTWTSTNATEVDLEPGFGKVEPDGSRAVAPSDSITYTLTAKGAGGAKVATASVTVTQPPPPRVVATGTVDFNSDPQGANIEVDGNLVGTTPSKIPLDAGPHKVVLTLRGYKKWEATLTVYSGAAQSVAPSLEKEVAPSPNP